MLEEKLTAGIIVKNTERNVAQAGLIDQVVGFVYDYNLDILLGPEWLFLFKDRLYTKSEKEELIRGLAEKTKDKDTLIIPGSMMWDDGEFFYNTAPVISKGALIREYHKHADGGDIGKAGSIGCRKKMYIDDTDGMFEWRGYKCGIEICADCGSLRRLLESSSKPFLDIYFLSSCGLSLGESFPVNDGYGLCSDGCGPVESKVFKKETNDKKENYFRYHPKKQIEIFQPPFLEKVLPNLWKDPKETLDVYELEMKKKC